MAIDTNQNKAIDNDANQDLIEEVLLPSKSPALSEYLLALIEVQQIINTSGAKDINSLRSYIDSGSVKISSNAVKSILEREVNELSKSSELSRDITVLQNGIVNIIEQVKELDSVVNRGAEKNREGVEDGISLVSRLSKERSESINPQVGRVLDQIVNHIVAQDSANSVEKANTTKVNQERGSDVFLMYQVSEISEAIRAMRLEEVRREGKLDQERANDTNVAEGLLSQNTEEVGVRSVGFANKGQGDVSVVPKPVDGTEVKLANTSTDNKSAELIDGRLIEKIEKAKEVERVKKQHFDTDVYADVFLDAVRESEASGDTVDEEIEEDVIHSLAEIEEEVLELGAEFVHSGTTIDESEDLSHNLEPSEGIKKIPNAEQEIGRER